MTMIDWNLLRLYGAKKGLIISYFIEHYNAIAKADLTNRILDPDPDLNDEDDPDDEESYFYRDMRCEYFPHDTIYTQKDWENTIKFMILNGIVDRRKSKDGITHYYVCEHSLNNRGALTPLQYEDDDKDRVLHD